jgi:quaternary ammonium compound-resistance protein SugE
MSWLILAASGVLESVWALALDRSDGFRRPVPTAVFVVALTLSMIGLGLALRELPVGTAYAVWVGIGASLTAIVSMSTGQEPATTARVLCIVAIVGGVAGLKVLA